MFSLADPTPPSHRRGPRLCTGLSSEASRRLVSLLGVLLRRGRALGPGGAPQSEDQHVQAQLLGDFLRMALESTSLILERNPGLNPELIYALLHRADLFQGLEAGDPGTARALTNIQARLGEGCWGVVEGWLRGRVGGRKESAGS